MKRFFCIIALILFTGTAAYAQTGIPQQGITVMPVQAKTGESITLTAPIYNGTNQSAQVTVVFRAADADIGTVKVTIASQSSKDATVGWTQPAVATVVSAEATKAVNTKGKAITELVGPLGSVTLGSTASSFDASSIKNTVSTYTQKATAFIEPFRVKQAAHFQTLRDEVKTRIGISVGEQVGEKVKDLIAPETPGTNPAPAQPAKKTLDNPLDYVTLVYAMALAAFFGNSLVFYVSSLIIVLWAIRFIIGRFI